eukprot:CAMPEP_0184012714 /NCGR_PEP_ID=MMETSP0954-20121128/4594_1 /TAXON_ID=627963 /ORGANISM="Aplanochytrium sp, Strain PBS07" /LENGTH=175 /DNA_ID=CAMNT_0026292789 /DNA_START=118 /DNA_END=645 /DNA_ORIENTATION=+
MVDDSIVTTAIIAKLKMDYDLELKKAEPDYTKKLRYGISLCSSLDRGQNRKGLEILYELKNECENQLVTRDLYIDCLYHLALCHFRLGEYMNSWRVADALLRDEPEHKGAVELRALSKSTLFRRAVTGACFLAACGYIYFHYKDAFSWNASTPDSQAQIEDPNSSTAGTINQSGE